MYSAFVDLSNIGIDLVPASPGTALKIYYNSYMGGVFDHQDRIMAKKVTILVQTSEEIDIWRVWLDRRKREIEKRQIDRITPKKVYPKLD